jgi:hypothetical protein
VSQRKKYFIGAIADRHDAAPAKALPSSLLQARPQQSLPACATAPRTTDHLR